MRTYKRSGVNLVKGIVLSPIAAAVVFVALQVVVRYFNVSLGSATVYLQYGVPVLVFVAMLYSTVVSESIKFTLDENGVLTYYLLGVQQGRYRIDSAAVSYFNKSIISGNSTKQDITLQIEEMGGDVEAIDCSALGAKKFREMFLDLEKYAQAAAVITEEQSAINQRALLVLHLPATATHPPKSKAVQPKEAEAPTIAELVEQDEKALKKAAKLAEKEKKKAAKLAVDDLEGDVAVAALEEAEEIEVSPVAQEPDVPPETDVPKQQPEPEIETQVAKPVPEEVVPVQEEQRVDDSERDVQRMAGGEEELESLLAQLQTINASVQVMDEPQQTADGQVAQQQAAQEQAARQQVADEQAAQQQAAQEQAARQQAAQEQAARQQAAQEQAARQQAAQEQVAQQQAAQEQAARQQAADEQAAQQQAAQEQAARQQAAQEQAARQQAAQEQAARQQAAQEQAARQQAAQEQAARQQAAQEQAARQQAAQEQATQQAAPVQQPAAHTVVSGQPQPLPTAQPLPPPPQDGAGQFPQANEQEQRAPQGLPTAPEAAPGRARSITDVLNFGNKQD